MEFLSDLFMYVLLHFGFVVHVYLLVKSCKSWHLEVTKLVEEVESDCNC